MKALLARIPRDRSLLLLLAPVLVLVAFLAASRSEDHYSALPVGATVPPSTTTTRPVPTTAGADEQVAEVEGTSVSRAGTTSGSGSSSGSGGSGSSRSSSTQRAASSGVGGESAEAAPSTTLPDWMTDGTTTTAAPDGSTTTTTVPDDQGPEPSVDEVPVAILLPISAVLVLGLGLFVVSRRRRRDAADSSRPPTPSA